MADRPAAARKPSLAQRIAIVLIERAEERLGVSLLYVRRIADADLGLLRRYKRIFGFLDPVTHLPADAHAAARLRGALAADCGSCVEAEISLARRAGLKPATIDAILAADQSLPAPMPAIIRLSDAVTRDRTDDPEAREEVMHFYGQRGLIELSFAMNGAALLPGIKRAMGHATTCDLQTLRKISGERG
ncbi:hypothetical protein SAMN05444004_10868 [Jannaschia faecimaris]|uniref:Alkylhydroperoxidase AhpD family core domain-containing protein n=1 Tax=Jannaschia faecimaris TaxID=1244108 RepID=A0A1H3RDH3_9RHOB|nr:hypothetical protein [Jannaschia faecimaris]SDZ23603.1 hypothetical protein SAMN05444004_10868 [Jannaschia faecimaris]